MRKVLVGFLLVAGIGLALYLRSRRPGPSLGVAYVANRDAILWSTTAQVRERLAILGYGERLDILGRSSDQVHVRTASGTTGWISQGDLLAADLWQKALDLAAKTAAQPVEARGHTRVLSNLHLDPGRDAPRIRQLARATPVELFERRALEAPATATPANPAANMPAGPAAPTGVAASAAAPAPTGSAATPAPSATNAPAAVKPTPAEPAAETASPPTEDEQGAAGQSPSVKKEDWWLVRARVSDQAPISGWILGRFIDLDVPAPLPDYANAAGMRIVAWFELNHVTDASGNAKPQYLVVGARGPEGQPCDFTLLRVYTWGVSAQRYETAFVASELCGKLPVALHPASTPGGDATFAFEDWSRGAKEQQTYHMHQTVVRRVKESSAVRTRH